jgi:hypothetical protein
MEEIVISYLWCCWTVGKSHKLHDLGNHYIINGRPLFSHHYTRLLRNFEYDSITTSVLRIIKDKWKFKFNCTWFSFSEINDNMKKCCIMNYLLNNLDPTFNVNIMSYSLFLFLWILFTFLYHFLDFSFFLLQLKEHFQRKLLLTW